MTVTQAPHVRRAPVARFTRLTIAGQAIGALAILVQWVAAPEVFADFGFPPGAFYVLGAAAIVWLDRGATWAPITTVVMAVWVIVGGLAGGDLIDNLASDNTGLVIGNVVMTLGLLFSAATGVLAIRENRAGRTEPQIKPLSRDNPRRRVLLVMAAGLLADALGDAGPEGTDISQWDGPGPVFFLLLAALVLRVPGRFMTLTTLVITTAFIVGMATNPEPRERLADPSNVVDFGFTVLQGVGLLVALVAGIVYCLPARRTAGAAVDRSVVRE